MTRNVGNLDKAIRLGLGAAIAGAGIYFQSWFGALAVVPIATALIGNCPLYSVLGLSTCPVKGAKDTSTAA